MHIASFLTCLISSSCFFLVLPGSAKLISLTQLLNALFILLKQSTSVSLFQALYVGCEVSPGFADAICMRLVDFTIKFKFLKLFEILDALPL